MGLLQWLFRRKETNLAEDDWEEIDEPTQEEESVTNGEDDNA